MNTPKAFANLSPGFELARTLGINNQRRNNPERVRRLANPFRVRTLFGWWFPGFSQARTLGSN